MSEKVWVVQIESCEGNYLSAICGSKKTATKILMGQRDAMVKKYRDMLDMDKAMYQGMIDALSDPDPEKWDNFPHETPRMFQMKVLP